MNRTSFSVAVKELIDEINSAQEEIQQNGHEILNKVRMPYSLKVKNF